MARIVGAEGLPDPLSPAGSCHPHTLMIAASSAAAVTATVFSEGLDFPIQHFAVILAVDLNIDGTFVPLAVHNRGLGVGYIIYGWSIPVPFIMGVAMLLVIGE